MNKLTVTLHLIFLLFLAGYADATPYVFEPGDRDLGDLDHHYYYTWGIDWSVPRGEEISSIRLEFDNIRNWDDNANVLYVHLLENAAAGIIIGRDGQGGGDNFAGQGTELFTWHDLPSFAQDLTYLFTADELRVFATDVADGNAGIAFDPDCHYWNDGILLIVETSSPPHITSVPEPGMFLMIGTGFIGLVSCRRNRKSATYGKGMS